MTYFKFDLIVLFSGCSEAKCFYDLVAIDKDSALADIANAYGETPELLGYTLKGEA